MPFNDISDPGQHATLVAVLDEICLAAGIGPHSPGSEDAAADELKHPRGGVIRHAWRA